MGEGIRAVLPAGVHHRHGVGQRCLALMVVCHHHIQPQGVGVVHLLVSGDAAVHGDHQGGPLVPEGADGVPAETVAVLDAPGDIPQAPDAAALQVVCQHHRGGDAVHVVVAEHGDGLPVRDGPLDPGHRLVHVPHQQGRQRQLPLPVQKHRRLFRRGDAPGRQHGAQQIGVSGGAQQVHVLLLRLADLPFLILQRSFLLSRSCPDGVQRPAASIRPAEKNSTITF